MAPTTLKCEVCGVEMSSDSFDYEEYDNGYICLECLFDEGGQE